MLKKNQKSQAMVEIALTLPIFLFIVMALIDFSYRFYLQLGLDDITVSAAQYGTTRNEALGYPPGMVQDPQNPYDFCPTEQMIRNYIATINRPPLDSTKIQIQILNTADTIVVGGTTARGVSIRLGYPLAPMTPFLGHLASSWSLLSEARMAKK